MKDKVFASLGFRRGKQLPADAADSAKDVERCVMAFLHRSVSSYDVKPLIQVSAQLCQRPLKAPEGNSELIFVEWKHLRCFHSPLVAAQALCSDYSMVNQSCLFAKAVISF